MALECALQSGAHQTTVGSALGLTIYHNLLAKTAARYFGLHLGSLSRATRVLSSGLRVSSASDSPADLAISELGKARAKALAQGERNIRDGLSLLETASGQMEVINTLLRRVTELAQQAATGTYSSHQREIIQSEAAQMLSELQRTGAAASFNGIRLLASNASLAVQTGDSGLEEGRFDLNLFRTLATSLGGSLETAQIAYRRLSIDGGSAGSAKSGATLEQSIQLSNFGNQTITVQSAGQAKTATISSEQGANSSKDILAALENLGLEGVRGSGSLTTADLSGFGRASLGGTEGDLVRFTVDVGTADQGSRTATVSYLIGQDEAATLANIGAALRRVAETVNTANSDQDLVVEGAVLQSQSGRRISVGDLEFADAAGVAILGIQGSASALDTIAMDVAGVSISVNNASHSAAMDSIYNQLVAGLTTQGTLFDPAQYQGGTAYTQPGDVAGWYTVRRDQATNSVVVTRIAASQAATQDIQVSLTGASLTQALAGNFTATAGREVYLSVEGTQVHYTASGSDATDAQRLASAIAAAGIANVSASASGSQATINLTAQPPEPIDLSGYFENRTALLSGFTGPAGATVSLSINGQALSFLTGATQAVNAQRLYNAIVGASPAGISASLDLGSGSVTIANQSNAAITITGYSDGGLNTTGLTVSALYGATGSQTLSATGVTGTVVNNPASGSMAIAPGAYATGGGALGVGTSVSVTRSSVQMTVGAVGAASSFSSGTTLDSTTNTSTTASRIDGGVRSGALASANGSTAQIASGSQQWATVNGVGYLLLDANIGFEAWSDLDGSGQTSGKGAFNRRAGEYANTEYITDDVQAAARISGFDNTAGDTVTFSIEGVSISFEAKGGDQQASNAGALFSALQASQAALDAAGVSFVRSENDAWVYLYKQSGNLRIEDYRDDNADTESGLTVMGVGQGVPVLLREGELTEATFTPFAAISQLDLRTQTGAGDALEILRQAVTMHAAAQAALGAQANVLRSRGQFAAIMRENTEAMVSRIIDADFATAVADQTRSMILAQSAQAMLAHANALPKMLLRLLQAGML